MEKGGDCFGMRRSCVFEINTSLFQCSILQVLVITSYRSES